VVGVAVDVVDSAGTPCPPGVVGEVVARGPNVTAGYWEDDEATKAAFLGGWYRLGDVGYFDEERNLWLLDRAKDMIVTGGENVYSIEVEEVLARHPAVVECAVFGIPDEQWVEAVHAVVVVGAPDQVSTELAEELRDHCRATIAGFKVPKRIELRTEPLPKSGPGKIQKRQLRAPYWGY
jgi:long-chain acyl-CoA synthetase